MLGRPLRVFIQRAWYYFRLGYSTYLSFLLGFVNFLILIHNFIVGKILGLGFMETSLILTTVIFPIAVFIGWLHMKRMGTFQQEMHISAEANPYFFQATPGKEIGLMYPMTDFNLGISEKSMRAMNELCLKVVGKPAFTEEDFEANREYRKSCRHIAAGGKIRNGKRV